MPESTTVAFPDRVDMFPSATNGTAFTEMLCQLKSPKKSTSSFAQTTQDGVRSVGWRAVKDGIGSLKNDATDSINERVNRVFQGTDVPELGNKVVDMMPVVKIPSMTQIDRVVDTLGDTSCPGSPEKRSLSHPDPHSHSELQGSQWQFAFVMGKEARHALVKQRICRLWQTAPSQSGPSWQDALVKALVSFYVGAKTTHTLDSLLDMKPVWIGDVEKNAWRLVLDSGIVDAELDGMVLMEAPGQLSTGFEIPEQNNWTSIQEHNRGLTRSVEYGEWEVVGEF
ncbi:hypothetical protein K505DRAFT_249909 [Melanomma pulvis-pyrius CBS 109.77]|uniref:Uncharacterized protein n=1 Tax=Melanomma pulvis-pyrius CBS 109.77 TaxID=1314802 RepID=A0A6A6X451_9PLEO|nr:hypothetical protein K505DRAFT_249909 [Melanomma pulvis-pyrius CBS 109.77]